ncbi:alpha/beta fold hydrolase [Corynebacterium sp.]|uniref:lipase family alpha/beta hydrolase n=1 Tax=Corynebacterium sp. TaxID=1720 RepID=UPI0026DB3239|nr:alpha/beta fold hydrolase [Corynebacterium sp.]MDO5032419.1 alpha/beta fold hydrolase [Corynebacterium sp.]
MQNFLPKTLVVLAASTALTALAAPAHASQTATELPQVPGASFNDPTCVPSNGSSPVVFLHGTSTSINDWKAASNYLAEQGYCTYAFNYGKEPGKVGYAQGDLDAAARDVEAGIQSVLDVTGAAKVNLVGHSQGGMMVKKYIEQLGHADQVDHVVTLAANFRGTDFNGSRGLRGLFDSAPGFWRGIIGTAGFQQVIGDAGETPQMAALNEHKDTSAGIVYTAAYSPRDTTVTNYAFDGQEPYGKNISSILEGPAGWVVNVNADEACGYSAPSAHPRMPMSPETIRLVGWGLSRTPSETQPECAA